MSQLDNFTGDTLNASLAQMMLRVAAAKLALPHLRVAVIGKCEVLLRFGEVLLGDERVTVTLSYFGPKKTLHIGQLSEFSPEAHDCFLIVGENAEEESLCLTQLLAGRIDELRQTKAIICWRHFTEAITSALSSAVDLPTCLNFQKCFAIGAAIYLCDRPGAVIECGVYQGGTTVFMGLVLRALKRPAPLYALDTFNGLPAPVPEDIEGWHFPTGHFGNTSVERVAQLYQKYGLAEQINIVPGLVQETLPQVFAHSGQECVFAFLDMDQYAGIYQALHELNRRRSGRLLVIVDDSTIPGVDRAIREACQGTPAQRKTITFNFEAISF